MFFPSKSRIYREVLLQLSFQIDCWNEKTCDIALCSTIILQHIRLLLVFMSFNTKHIPCSWAISMLGCDHFKKRFKGVNWKRDLIKIQINLLIEEWLNINCFYLSAYFILPRSFVNRILGVAANVIRIS